MTDHIARKTAINKRVQARYGELMREGRHGHYETMFRVVHEELARAEKVIEWARTFHKLTVEDAQINGLICQTAEVWGARWNLGTLLDQRDAEYDRPSAPLDGTNEAK